MTNCKLQNQEKGLYQSQYEHDVGNYRLQDYMIKRNRYLVDNSSLCICYLTRQTGGTAYTVRYAESKGVTVLNLSKQP